MTIITMYFGNYNLLSSKMYDSNSTQDGIKRKVLHHCIGFTLWCGIILLKLGYNKLKMQNVIAKATNKKILKSIITRPIMEIKWNNENIISKIRQKRGEIKGIRNRYDK